MAIDKIVILEALSQPPATPKFAYVMRLDVPRFRWSQFQTSLPNSHFPHADAETLAAIKEGRITEQRAELTTTGATWAGVRDNPAVRQAIQTELEAQWQTAQDALTAERPWSLFGAGWDGDAWHL